MKKVLGDGMEPTFIRTNRQQLMPWILNHAVQFNSTDSLATYGRKQWPTIQGIGTISITRKDALKHSEIVAATYEHIGDSPFVGNYQHIFLAEPRRVKLVDGEFVEEQGNTAAYAKARLGASDLWLVDTCCGHGLVSATNAKLSKGKINSLGFRSHFKLPMAMPLAPIHFRSSSKKYVNEMIEPLMLKNTSSVLSVGDRAMDKGCSFLWIACRNSYWITPEVKVITLEVLGGIPYLRRNSEFCEPRDAIASDYMVPRAMGMPSVKDDAHDTSVEEAADPLVDPPIPDVPDGTNEEPGEDDDITIRNLRQDAKSLTSSHTQAS